MLWGLGFGGEIQLKITHSLCETVNLCIKPGLNTFSHISPPQQVCLIVQSHAIVSVYVFGGRYKAESMSNYLDRISKWLPVPLKRDGCLIPNLIGTYLCGAKNERKFPTKYSTGEK